MENTSTWEPSPNSPTSSSNPKGFGVWLTLLVLAGTLFTVFVSQIVTFAVLYQFGAHVGDPRHPTAGAQLAVAAVSDAAITLYLLAVLPVLAKCPLSALGIRAPGPRELRIGLIGAVALTLIADPLAGALQSLTHATHPEAALTLLRGLHGPWQIAAFVVLACVLAPITEELIFRAFIFNAVDRYAGFWPAAVISGIIFGLVHVSNSPLDIVVFALPLAIGGVVLATVYTRAKCYWSNVIAHALFNSVAVAAILVLHADI